MKKYRYVQFVDGPWNTRSKTGYLLEDGLTNYHWEYAFLIGAFCLMIATLITNTVEEKE